MKMSKTQSRSFYLIGILAAILLIFVIIAEGSAHTASSPPASRNTQPIQVADFSPPSNQESAARENNTGQKVSKSLDKNSEELGNSIPTKKKMGLALLFLGMLAEHS